MPVDVWKREGMRGFRNTSFLIYFYAFMPVDVWKSEGVRGLQESHHFLCISIYVLMPIAEKRVRK